MKKRIIALLTLGIAVSLVTGCGTTGTPASSESSAVQETAETEDPQQAADSQTSESADNDETQMTKSAENDSSLTGNTEKTDDPENKEDEDNDSDNETSVEGSHGMFKVVDTLASYESGNRANDYELPSSGSDDYWTVLYYYAGYYGLYSEENDMLPALSGEEIEEVSYSLFSDFDGTIPETDTDIVKSVETVSDELPEDALYIFYAGNRGEDKTEITHEQDNEDGSVDITANIVCTEPDYEGMVMDSFTFHCVPNEQFKEDAEHSYPYTVDSVNVNTEAIDPYFLALRGEGSDQTEADDNYDSYDEDYGEDYGDEYDYDSEDNHVSEYFTDEQLQELREALWVPDDPEITVSVGEENYWEAGECYYVPVTFMKDGQEVAGADINPDTCGMLGNILMYSDENY